MEIAISFARLDFGTFDFLAPVRMSAYGYEETLERLSLGVCYPPESRRRRGGISDIDDWCLVPAPKQTPETSSLKVCS